MEQRTRDGGGDALESEHVVIDFEAMVASPDFLETCWTAATPSQVCWHGEECSVASGGCVPFLRTMACHR